MAENREDILNELIQYYDRGSDDKKEAEDNKAETESDPKKSDEPSAPEDMGATRVIIKKHDEPDTADDLGDTVVMPRKSLQQQVNDTDESEPVTEETVRIDTSPAHTANEPVAEEVLGNMDLYGASVSEPRSDESEHTPMKNNKRDFYDDEPRRRRQISIEPDEDDEDYYDEDERGIWYALKPLWVTLILSAIAFGGIWFYLTDNVYVGTYKRNFEYNMDLILDSIGIELDPASFIPTQGDDLSDSDFGSSLDVLNSTGEQYDEVANDSDELENIQNVASNRTGIERETVTLPFVDAGSSGFSVYDNGVACAKSNYLCLYNSIGRLKWELNTNISNPLISTAGKYIAIASEGGTAVSLYKGDKLQFNIEIQNTIVSCEVSERGDVVLVTDRPAYKGAVLVINKYGEEIFSWASGVNYITASTITKTRVLSVSLVDTSSTVNSYVMMFDISAPEPFAGIELQNTLVFNLFNNGSDVFASGDNSIISLTDSCGLRYDKRYDDVYISCTAHDEKGNRIVAFTDDNLPIVNLYSPAGDLEASAIIENKPDFIDVYRSTVLYCYERDIICGKAGSDNKSVYTAPMTVNDVLLLNSGSYVIIYGNSIEFVEI